MGRKIQSFLILLGKPFYYLISYTILFVLSSFYFVGNITVTSFSKVKKFASKTFGLRRKTKKVKKVEKKTKKIKIVKRKSKPFKFVFRFPKISFSNLFVPLRLFIQKIRLFFLRLGKGIVNLFSGIKPSTKTVVIFILLSSFIFSFWWFILRGLPSPKTLLNRNLEVSTKIYDRNGILLYKIFKNKNRSLVPLSDIPMQLRLATLAAEDAEFYIHPGFSIKGIFRALIKNLKEGKISGGSTITQQLVKNALLTPEKTIQRKIKEIILAIATEKVLSKDQILEMYLNEIPYGGTAYGVKEAASLYFDKEVDELTIAESSLLAGLTKSPTKLSPHGPNPELAFERQREVLHLMKINKYITAEQEEDALNEKIILKSPKTDIKSPHFVMYVRQLLVDMYGEEAVEKGGLEVTTTLDYPTQKMAEEIVLEEVNKLKGLNVGNGAAVVLDPKNGEILAMVGSKDYFDPKVGNVNVTIRPRQPGSSIKIVNYAYALSNGFSLASIIDDSPVAFSTPGQPVYSPVNYDGKYRGKISLRSALAESRNIPAVKVLASYGVTKMIELGKEMGITTWEDKSRFGLSLTLGGGEVKLLELAQVYATVANYGERPMISSILKVSDYKGKVLFEEEIQTKKVLSPEVSYLLIDILKDNFARSPAFGYSSYLVIPNHPEVAVKTGTSNNLKDNLAVGFNQKYLVAVWVGNNDGSPMSRVASGVTGASPIWNKIMRGILGEQKSIDWEIPEGIEKVAICPITGTLPCQNCPSKYEYFVKGTAPKIYCKLDAVPTPIPTGTNKILDTGASTTNNQIR